jgi:hypothetical protein
MSMEDLLVLATAALSGVVLWLDVVLCRRA